MPDLKDKLKSILKGAERIAVLGVGSELRADDIAGILAAQELDKASEEIGETKAFKVFLGYSAPENLAGEIKKFKPTHLVIIDSAEMGKPPGDIAAFPPEEAGGMSFSTHKLPVKVLAQYLRQSFECKMVIVGIQPKTLDFGKDVSSEVKKAVNEVSRAVKDAIINPAK
jgi:hydrogenase 3 maturation protease